jgi:hypothetical protein
MIFSLPQTGSTAMHDAAIDESADVFACEGTDLAPEARRMTSGQLRQLGVSRLVYLRAGTMNGEAAYAIHAADGTTVAIVEDVGLAIELVAEQGMTFVTVH